MPRSKTTDDRKFAIEACRLANDRHCTDIVLLDLKGISPATDYFVIATGTSDRQAKSVADEICNLARQRFGQSRYGSAGLEHGKWILLDFVNVVIHLFDPDTRDYYDLEMLWGDAKKVRWQKPAKRKAAAPKTKKATASAD